MEHVLSGFDIPSCCLGYDGDSVFATKDGHIALTTGINTARSCHRSTCYEDRLIKYATRGFAIHVPELDWKRVPADLPLQGDICFHQMNLPFCFCVVDTYDKSAGAGAFVRRSRGLLRLVLFDLLTTQQIGLLHYCLVS